MPEIQANFNKYHAVIKILHFNNCVFPLIMYRNKKYTLNIPLNKTFSYYTYILRI